MTNDAGIPENGRERARPSVTRVISQATGPASLVEWAKLALDDPKAPVLRLARVRHDDRFGTLHEEIVLSLGHFPGLPADEPIPDIAELAHRYGLGLGKSTTGLTSTVPRTAPGILAAHLMASSRLAASIM